MTDYVNKDDSELKQLAMDIYENKVFTNRHIDPSQVRMLNTIFMPIALGAFSNFTPEDVNQIGLIYEYYSQAGPRSMNGYPIFTSVHLLNVVDTVKMAVFYDKYEKLKKAFEDDTTSPVLPNQV